MKYGNKSPLKRVVSSPITAALAFIVFGLITNAAWKVHAKAVASSERLEQSQNSLRKLQNRQEELGAKVAYLSTDDGIKSEIRNKFRAAETGESVAVIIDNRQMGSTSTSTVSTNKPWWSKFFGR